MDPKLFDAAKQQNVCGVCAVNWQDCHCDGGARTESIASLLNNPHIFPNTNSRHLCVFLYHSYQRWTDASHIDDFSVGCLPPWEGWYAAWLKPSNGDLARQSCCEDKVLLCTVQYCNGASADAFIDSAGNLIINLPGPRPPGALDYDQDRHIVRHRVAVTQYLSVKEIERSSRGIVHNAAKVSHIVRQEDSDRFRVSKLPRNPSDRREIAVVSLERIKTYAPHLYEEMHWRSRRRFTKRVGEAVQRFMHLLFQTAMLADEAARYALQRRWADTRTGPNEQLRFLRGKVQALASIPDTTTKRVDSRETVDEARGRKRLRH